jgi:hypothetical protein
VSTGDKIAWVGLVVGAFGCVGTWLVVPGIQGWADKHRRLIVLGGAILLTTAVFLVFWLQSGSSDGRMVGEALEHIEPKSEPPKPLPVGAAASDVQTSFGRSSPNIKSSGSGPVTVTIQDQAVPASPPARPDEKNK